MIDKDIQPILGETKQIDDTISNKFTYDNNQYIAYIKKAENNMTKAFVFLMINNEIKSLSLYTEYNVPFNKEEIINIINKFIIQTKLNTIDSEDDNFIEFIDVKITMPTLSLGYDMIEKAISKYLSKCRKNMCSNCMFYNTCVLINEQTNQLLCNLLKQTDNLNIKI